MGILSKIKLIPHASFLTLLSLGMLFLCTQLKATEMDLLKLHGHFSKAQDNGQSLPRDDYEQSLKVSSKTQISCDKETVTSEPLRITFKSAITGNCYTITFTRATNRSTDGSADTFILTKFIDTDQGLAVKVQNSIKLPIKGTALTIDECMKCLKRGEMLLGLDRAYYKQNVKIKIAGNVPVNLISPNKYINDDEVLRYSKIENNTLNFEFPLLHSHHGGHKPDSYNPTNVFIELCQLVQE